MVAPEDDRGGSGRQGPCREACDVVEGPRHVGGDDVSIAEVDDASVQHLVMQVAPAGGGVEVSGLPRDEAQRVLPDGPGPEARPGHERRTLVGGCAQDDEVGLYVVILTEQGRTKEGGDPGEREIGPAGGHAVRRSVGVVNGTPFVGKLVTVHSSAGNGERKLLRKVSHALTDVARNHGVDVKRDLLVGVAQWLAAPGEPRHNMAVALAMVEDAASRGVELLVLPELWSCGYDPETLAEDARNDAELRQGPRSQQLADAARGHDMWLAAGSVPELGEDGRLYDTALVFNPEGDLVAWHRKAHLYPPTLEPTVFSAGDRLTTFEDPALGCVGLVVCFDGDFPEVARTLALPRCPPGARPLGLRGGGGRRLGPAVPGTRAHQQPVVGAGQPGWVARHLDAARRQPHRGAHGDGGGGGRPGRSRLLEPGGAARAPHRSARRLRPRGHRRLARGRAASRDLRRRRPRSRRSPDRRASLRAP